MKLHSKIAVIITLILGLQFGFSFLIFQVQSSENVSDEIVAILETSMGNITIRLREDMPITVGNFLYLLEQGVYNNTIFHRVIPDFMIQGGDPTGTGYGDPSIPKIQDEFSENPENNKNYRGTIAMANTGAPNSGSSQFFINVVYNSHLNTIHPVFGDIMDGMDVVDTISTVNTDSNRKPLSAITINGTQLIPEFPKWIIFPLLLVASFVAILT